MLLAFSALGLSRSLWRRGRRRPYWWLPTTQVTALIGISHKTLGADAKWLRFRGGTEIGTDKTNSACVFVTHIAASLPAG